MKSIYRSEEGKNKIIELYDSQLSRLSEPWKDRELSERIAERKFPNFLLTYRELCRKIIDRKFPKGGIMDGYRRYKGFNSGKG